MNIWQITSIVSGVAFVVLAFLAVRALEQREYARRRSAALARELNDIVNQRDNAQQELYELREKQRGEVISLNHQLAKLEAARNVAWTKPAKRMPANEVKRAFALDAAAPIWIALHQELDDFLQDQFDQVSLAPSATMTEEARLHLAGGIEQIRQFQKRLLELHAAASKADADLEDEDEKKGTP